jgi:hypothetical protein
VVAYADACGVELRTDATETQVRRPRAHRPGRRSLVSGKRKQNTIKATTCSDGHGRILWSGAVRPGRLHDQTAAKTEGIADLLGQHPTVKVWVDEGYRGLATAFPDQVHAPPRKPPKDPPAEQLARYEQARRTQSSRRIRVEPGDRAFHHQPPAPVAFLEAAGGRAAAGGAQLVLVGVDADRASVLGGGAAPAQWAALAP